MSIQVYECKDNHRDEVFLRGLDVPQTHECSCGKPAFLVISAPSVINVKRDWNDKASDQQRNPYEQARAQLNNMANEARDRAELHGTPPTKITEANIQEAAKQIDAEQRTRATRPTPQQRQVRHARKQARKTIAERNQT